ncbi:MAG: NUDIX domain-containing protein [Parachlamydiaceae bacterium]|nr:MAG: NUDIX domain-containing protein [Parachlamydiaceae bacterium]
MVIQVAGRHATGSLEIEIARGASKSGENNPEDTARRELAEETGFKAGKIKQLGNIAVDTGLTASIVPIFLGKLMRKLVPSMIREKPFKDVMN